MTFRDTQRDALLLAALPHIAFDGWTDSALLAGAAEARLHILKTLFDDVLSLGHRGAPSSLLHGWGGRCLLFAVKNLVATPCVIL